VEDLGHEAVVHVDTGALVAAPATTRLDLPGGDGDLAQFVAGSPTAGEPAAGGPLRRTFSRVVPHRDPAERAPTARTEYGFYPRYEPEAEAREPRGDLLLRVPRSQMPKRGDRVALRLDLDRVYLFDGAGERIRLPARTG
jgi:multiple sugar transport system ATP-binding protein